MSDLNSTASVTGKKRSKTTRRAQHKRKGTYKRKATSVDRPSPKKQRDHSYMYNLLEGVPADYTHSEKELLDWSQTQMHADIQLHVQRDGISPYDVDLEKCTLIALDDEKVPNRMLKQNQRKWQKIQDIARNWVDSAGATVANFVVMKLSFGKLEWGGPAFMGEFVKDKVVLAKFVNTAMKRPSQPSVKKTVGTSPQVNLKGGMHGISTKDLSCASMRHLISNICNKKHIRRFWIEENRPLWWPHDVPFVSPNAVPGGSDVKRLRVNELMSVLDAYKKYFDTDSTSLPGQSHPPLSESPPSSSPSPCLPQQQPLSSEPDAPVFSKLPSSEPDPPVFNKPDNVASPLKVPKKISDCNQQKWKRIQDVARNWVDSAGETVSSFVVMKYSKGRLEWGGPAFMGEFVKDKVVLAKFINTAMKRHSEPTVKKSVGAAPKVSMKSGMHGISTKEMSCASMRCLISNICNRKNVKGFWTEDNRPFWWPLDVPFLSPNAAPIGFKRLRVNELMSVLDAYKKHFDTDSTSLPGQSHPPLSESPPSSSLSPCLPHQQPPSSEPDAPVFSKPSSESDPPVFNKRPSSKRNPRAPSKLEKLVSSLKVQNKILQRNQRKWKKIQDMASYWVDNAGDTVSSFVVMKLSPGKLEWEGPAFMEEFVKDNMVLAKFVNTAMKRPSLTSMNESVHKLY